MAKISIANRCDDHTNRSYHRLIEPGKYRFQEIYSFYKDYVLIVPVMFSSLFKWSYSLQRKRYFMLDRELTGQTSFIYHQTGRIYLFIS